MLKLVLAVAVTAGLVAGVTAVPLSGRTVLDRWRASRGPTQFAERGWAELKGALGLAPAGAHGVRPAPPRAPRSTTARPARPTEQHTEQDRAALDRLVVEHAGR